MNNILRIAGLSFTEGIRHKVIYGVTGFGLLMALITWIFTPFIGYDVGKVAIDFMLSSISIGCLMIIFFLCLPGLNNDIEEQGIYFILSSPVKRSEYILGKFLGYSLIIFVCLLILSIPAFLTIKVYTIKYSAYVPLQFTWGKLTLACFFKFFSSVIFLSVVFLIRNLMSTGFLTSMTSIIIYMISQNINAVKNITMASEKITAFSKQLISFVSWIFPNLSYFNLNTYASYGITLPKFYFAKILIYGLSYIIITIMFSIFLFKKREL